MHARFETGAAFALLTAFMLGVAGCGRGAPKTYPIHGKLEIAGGDVRHLAGSHVEAALVSDETKRASGVIRDDGGFTLETLHAGAGIPGARAGSYVVRIVLGDDDASTRRRAAQALAARYRDFKTSGLTFDVPSVGPITLAAAAR